ncbi:MAG: dephospho-CoA kinase [bacterium]|nr:dephospho-CoA kinase [bacterium]MDT8395138.1 dephospho-CoA kinase [bacterium]
MPVIAITGGLGSGKSTVREIFEEFGAKGVDTDEIARRVIQPGTRGSRMVREAFGDSFFTPEGQMDRKKMAGHVFSDPSRREKLESILHPLIREAEDKVVRELLRKDPGAVVVVEVPLLAEGDRAGHYDGVVLVTAPEDVRMDRLVRSGRYTRDEAALRMAHQADDRERERVASWIVENSGPVGKTRSQVRSVLDQMV